jgi:hypothetical protein
LIIRSNNRWSISGRCDNNEYNGSAEIVEARAFVKDKTNTLFGKRLTDTLVDNIMFECYVAKLKVGRASGLDDMMTERLQFACGKNVVALVPSIFNMCLFGIAPRSVIFKRTLTLSKLVQIIILSPIHTEFGDTQFGIIAGRST